MGDPGGDDECLQPIDIDDNQRYVFDEVMLTSMIYEDDSKRNSLLENDTCLELYYH
jgi:hypothetical protein